ATIASNVPESPRSPRAAGKPQADMTLFAGVVGTVEYMAPEQARGDAVDQRADIYAFGLIVYDMLAGRRSACHDPGALAGLRPRAHQPLPPSRTIIPDVPEPLARVIARFLEPEVAARFQPVDDVQVELDRLDERGHLRPVQRSISARVAV